MILGYKKLFPWNKPTEFDRKIINGHKKHTIRVDEHDRWRKGRRINHCHGVRTKCFDNFYNNDCNGIQTIEIIWYRSTFFLSKVIVYVDCNKIGYFYPERIDLTDKKVIELALNDGFDSVVDFFKWFDKDFEGKIIHWTDLRY